MRIDWKEQDRLNNAHLEAMQKVTANHLDEYRKYFDDACQEDRE